MNSYVVDAGIIAAAYFQEEHAVAAQAILSSAASLVAPDLIYAEVANVVWKRHGRGEIDAQEASALVADLIALPLEITPALSLVTSALELALRTGRTVYDSLYLALAINHKSILITTDRKLVRSLERTPLAKHVAWIGQTALP